MFLVQLSVIKRLLYGWVHISQQDENIKHLEYNTVIQGKFCFVISWRQK